MPSPPKRPATPPLNRPAKRRRKIAIAQAIAQSPVTITADSKATRKTARRTAAKGASRIVADSKATRKTARRTDAKSASRIVADSRPAAARRTAAKSNSRIVADSKPAAARQTAAKGASRIVADSSRAKRKPQSVDDYLAQVSAVQRRALEQLRRAIRRAAPRAEECINYGLAAFRLEGKTLVGFGATPKHCAFYPMSGRTVQAHRGLLGGFETTKGSIHFQPENPLSAALVKTLVLARIAELRG